MSWDADGKSSSLSEEFGLILEEDGIYKTLPGKQLHCRSSESFFKFYVWCYNAIPNCVEHNDQTS